MGVKNKRTALLLTGAVATMLAGCGRGTPRQGDGTGGLPAPGSASADAPGRGAQEGEPSADKLNAYIEGYNTLIGTFGLQQQFVQYKGQQVALKSVNDPVFVNIGWIDGGLRVLQKGRHASGRAPELDAAADRELAALAPLVAQLKGLNVYYTSRGQLADGFVRGKREDPQVIARFEHALGALPALSDAIEQVQDRRDTAALAKLKASGDTIGYDHGLAMQKAKQLLAISASPADLRDPGKLAKGDRLIVQIQQALAEEAQVHAKTANSIDHGARDSMYESSADRLQGMIGAYRTLRQTPSAFARQAMIFGYNGAVEQANFAP